MRRIFFLFVIGISVVATSNAQTFFSDAARSGIGFGGSVAIGVNDVFVGSAPTGWPHGAEPAGTVYHYALQSNGIWAEAGRWQASDKTVGDLFGRSIAASKSRVVIGAPSVQKAYVFEKDAGGAWAEVAILAPSAVEEGSEFGGAYARGGNRSSAIAMADDRIAVTSYNTDTQSGAVHVFEQMGDHWMETAVLTPEMPMETSEFGWSVAAEQNRIFVGAPAENEQEGAVYVYHYDNGTAKWVQENRLAPEQKSARAALGRSISVEGDRLYAGAPSYEQAGAVFVFVHNGSTWVQESMLIPAPPEEGTRGRSGFGMAVAASGTTVFVSSSGTVLSYDLASPARDPFLISPQDDHSQPGFGVGLAVSGNVAVIGSPTADYDEGIATLYEKVEGSSSWEPESKLISEVSTLSAISGSETRCEDGTAEGFDCEDIDLVAFLPVNEISSERGVKLSDIWGWEDPVTGKEWVLQGRTDGLSIIDISNPMYPVFVGELMRTEGSPGSSWRDVKVYKDHAFIVADGAGEHGIQILDLTQLRDVNPDDMPVQFQETAHYSGVHSTHNIVINEETGFAYAVGNRAGGETCNGQLHMINIQDPVNPTFAGCFSHEAAGGTHDSQCVVYHGGDSNYVGREICLNSNASSFIIADVTDKDNPVTLAQATYPNVNYTHQGWLSEDHNYFYMNDELDELNGAVGNTRTLIWDVRDLEDPTLVKEFMLDSKASDHNLYVRGNFLYESNYQAGLRILDISDPENPVEVGRFDTTPYGDEASGFGGTWSNYPFFRSGVIVTGSRGEGLFLLRKREVGL